MKVVSVWTLAIDVAPTWAQDSSDQKDGVKAVDDVPLQTGDSGGPKDHVHAGYGLLPHMIDGRDFWVTRRTGT